MKYAQHFQQTPQSAPIPGKPMVQNAAGGYVFEVDDWQRLRRFLILGCEGGSYYESERKLTLENAECIRRCLAADGKRTVEAIVEVSDRGLAPKNDPAVFALACATKFGDDDTRKIAFAALPKICRIGTHLFQFAEARQAIGGGWGRGAREAIAKWYDRKDLLSQVLKYQQRNGWSHRDLLRLAHPQTDNLEHRAIFSAVLRGDGGNELAPSAKGTTPVVRSIGKGWAALDTHPLAHGYLAIQKATTAKEAAQIIQECELPRELVPTQFLSEAPVWDALLPHMPITAMVRNLGNLSKCGLLAPLSEASKLVATKLSDETAIRRSRIHPFAILLASKTYASGHGLKGGGTWTVVPQVIESLDGAFNLAFHNVEPNGKRYLLGIDVSGSMSWTNSSLPMMPAEAAAAMALITARTEPNYYAMGFATSFVDLGISARDTLPTVLKKTSSQVMGGTDTSVAIRWALANNIGVDVFVVYTDNETWTGDRHTCQALQDYRKRTGVPAKLAVVAFTGTNRSVADGADFNSMDFVGLDASLPQLLSAFALS